MSEHKHDDNDWKEALRRGELYGAWKSEIFMALATLRVVTSRLEEIYDAKNISLREVWVLMAAGARDSSQKEIAEVAGINLNVMVHLIDRLEQKRLLTRVRNPENRREYVLKLTRKGDQLVKWVLDNYDESAAKAWHPLDAHARATLRDCCVRLLATE